MSTAPENLDQLGDSLGLLERLQAEKPKTEAQFQPLSDQFEILKKYEVLIPDPVSHMNAVYYQLYVCVCMCACGIITFRVQACYKIVDGA